MRLDYFTEEELNAAIQQAIADRLTPNMKPHVPSDRAAFLIVGQPGAGKTTLASIFHNQLQSDLFFVNGDDYRQYHPRYLELVEKFGEDEVLHTQKFAGKVTEGIIQQLSDQGYNLMIEGTLRTKEVPESTCKMLKKKDYNVTLAGILTRPEVSYLSVLKRFELMKRLGTIPRKTPKEHHDQVVKAIVQNLDYLYHKRKFDRIVIYDRQQEKLYDSADVHQRHRSPADVYSKEFSRKLSSDERKQIMSQYKDYAGAKVVELTLKQYEASRLQGNYGKSGSR